MSIVIDKQVKLKEGSFHIHDSYEIVIIESGNAILKGLDLNYNLSKGDAIIIPPNFKHVFAPKNGELAYYEFSFNYQGYRHYYKLCPQQVCEKETLFNNVFK